MHNGLLQLGEQKMSKSLGNLITIKQILGKVSADVVRLFVLNSHYRNPLTYTEAVVQAASGGVERLQRVGSRQSPPGAPETLDAEPFRQRFIEAMDDDFNTPQALAALFDLAREVNQAADSGAGFAKAQSVLISLAKDVFGLRLPPVTERFTESFATVRKVITEEQALVQRLIQERLNARKQKQFQRADAIRQGLAALGVQLEDTKTGTDVIYKNTPSVEALKGLMKELGLSS